MQDTHTCPECKGSGCTAQPLRAPDDSLFLFPRCELCKGQGRLSDLRYTSYVKARDKS